MGICGSSNNEDPARSSASPASASPATTTNTAPAAGASTAAAPAQAPAPAPAPVSTNTPGAQPRVSEISGPIRPTSASVIAREHNKSPQPEFAVMWEEVLTELHRESVLIAQRAAAGHQEGSGAVEPPNSEELKRFCDAEKQKFAEQRTAAFEKIFSACKLGVWGFGFVGWVFFSRLCDRSRSVSVCVSRIVIVACECVCV